MKIKHNFFLLTLILLTFAGGIILYPSLPDQLPIHWNIKGEVDNYGSKNFTVFFFPGLILGLYLLLTYVPMIDPRKENYEKFESTYNLIKVVIVVFLIAMYFMMLAVGMGFPVKVDLLVRAGVAILFTLIGNYMGKVRHNYFVGIRTPWTLADEEVWSKTHRLGARLFVISGILGLLSLPFGVPGAYFNTLIFFLPLISVVYSYMIYRKKHS